MMGLFHVRRLWAAGVLVWLCGLTLQAAAATRLSGILSDPQGQVVLDATVGLLRRADSTRLEAKTNAQGQYAFDGVDDGEYRLSAESPGFAVLTRTVVVLASRRQTENLQFSKLSSQNESVNVTAAVSDVGVLSQTRPSE